MNNKSDLFEIPILFLIFNRLDTTKQVFEKIRSVKPRYLYIASDGPRSSKFNENQIVKEVRTWILENIDWDCEYKLLFRENNLGCGIAVSTAINWFFENVEMGIILEDDCLVDLSFFRFSEELLYKYKYDTKITSICSSNTIGYSSDTNSYTFSKYSLIWGWATWKRAWNKYDFNIESWPALKANKWLKSINKSFRFYHYWTHVFDTCYEKRVNTWDYQWNFTSFLNEGLSIIPHINLVRNIGIGINQTHQVDERYSKYLEQEIKFPLKHPQYISINYKVDIELEKKIFSLSFTDLIIIFIKKIPLSNSFIKFFKSLKNNLVKLRYSRI